MWEKKLPTKVNITRAVNFGQNVLEMIDVHVFGDASLLGKYAVVYAAIQQSSEIEQVSVASKSRFVKTQLTIPRVVERRW